MSEHMTVAEIRALLSAASPSEYEALRERLAGDCRSGVRAAVDAAASRVARRLTEDSRLATLYSIEFDLGEKGHVVAGVDEVGRGALAGPVSAGAVVLPARPRIDGLNDSKKLSPARRREIAAVIKEVATSWSVSHVEAFEIDAVGIAEATRRAMIRAVETLDRQPTRVLVDGNPIGLGYDEMSIVKGDSAVAAIAAASIIAKVSRDALMVQYAEEYPGFELEINKGYGTAEHISSIRRTGPSPIHRRSFAPCSEEETLF